MFANLSIKTRLIFVIGLLSFLSVAIGYLGVRGMGTVNEGLRTVYEDRLIPSGQLGEINIITADTMRQIHLMLMYDPRLPESKLQDHPMSFHTDLMAENARNANKLLKDYLATYLTPEEKELAEDYQAKRKAFQVLRDKTVDSSRPGSSPKPMP